MNADRPAVLFVSTMTVDFRDPDPRVAARWRGLAERFRVWVICFSRHGFEAHQRFGCRFMTLPKTFPLVVRVLLYYSVVPLVAGFLALRGISTWVAQSPYEAGAVALPRMLLGRPLGVRLIVEAHGDWIESLLLLRSPPARDRVEALLRGYSTLVLACCDGLRSVSRHTRGLLESYRSGIPHRTFPGYMDLEPHLRTTQTDKQARETDQVLYAGALTRLKGVDLLLDAWRTIRREPPVRLVLCGEGPFRDRIETRAGGEDGGGAVQLRGYLPPDQLRSEMLRSRLLVLPSRTEGFGRVLLEAMAVWTPVVATNTGGPREILARSHGGILVPVGRSDKLARAILRLLDRPSLRRRLGRNGRGFAEQFHDPRRFFEEYHRLVRALGPRSGSPSSSAGTASP